MLQTKYELVPIREIRGEKKRGKKNVLK